MDTDRLIRALAADNGHRARPVGYALMLALLAAAPVSLLMFFTELGVRPDVMMAMRNPFFDLKFAVTLALAIAAIAVSLHLSRPEASLRGFGWLLVIPAGILTAGIGGEMMMPQRLPMMTRLVGKNSWVCMTAIPLLSLPILAAALMGLRHGAPSRPAVAGAIAGMLSAGLAATLYASHCTDDSPLFVATWYTLATALVTAIGALAGSKLLKVIRLADRDPDCASLHPGYGSRVLTPPARSAACDGSAAPAVRSMAATARRYPCRRRYRSGLRQPVHRAC